MALKQIVENADAQRRMRADILMSSGSYAAVEALMHVASEHREQARREADRELQEHWAQVVDILWIAKNKIAEIK